MHCFRLKVFFQIEGETVFKHKSSVSLQVNMMASAMMADTTGGVGTVADLAPTMTMGLKVGPKHDMQSKLVLT